MPKSASLSRNDVIKCVGALIYDRRKNMFLLQQRSKTASHPLKWGLWGGKVERGENFPDAFKRELTEELTTPPEIETLIPLDFMISNDNKFLYYSYIVVTSNYDHFSITNESNDYVWLPLDCLDKIDLHHAARKTFNKTKNILNDCVKNYNLKIH